MPIQANELPPALEGFDGIVMPMLHGAYGEDGALARDLEARGLMYAGTGAVGSVLCYDKLASLALAQRIGLRTSPCLYHQGGDLPPWQTVTAALGPCVIVKPRREGSSVGLYKIADAAQWAAVPTQVPVLIERYIEGKDLTVGVLDGKALGVVGICPATGLYDYASKYTPGQTQYETPARIEAAQAAAVCDAAERLWAVSECRDYARFDFRIEDSGEIWYLETNTAPGMTDTSLLPKSAALVGYTFEQLLTAMLAGAVNRWEQAHEKA